MENSKKSKALKTLQIQAISVLAQIKNTYTPLATPKTIKAYLAAYAINRINGDLSLLNHITGIGDGACYLSVNQAQTHVLTANYGGGDIRVFGLDKDGKITQQTDRIDHKGSSIRPQQKSPHPHMILPAPKKNIFMVPDLGIDKVMIYKLNKRTGKLQLSGNEFAQTPEGAGPRHFVFHPKGKFAYVVNELEGSVTAFNYKAKDGSLDAIETVSTLPKDFEGEIFSADIHISPDGQYLYASNRGPNSMAVMKINPEDGTLDFLGTFTTGGNWPRAFGIDPTGNFMIVHNQRSDNVTIYKINKETGFTSKLKQEIEMKSPQCVKFLEKN